MYKIFSVDDHIIEPDDVWTNRVSRKFRDAAPHVVEEGGRQYWEYEGRRILTMGLNAVAGKPREEWSSEPLRFTDMLQSCYDPVERAKDFLSQGVLASVGFPSLPRFGGMLFAHFDDKELAHECVMAWNDFVLDEWCPSGPPGLYVPMIICDVWDPVAAAAEIRRCVDKGARALCFTENPVPDGLPSFHAADHWDPIWRAAEEAGIPVCMHIASSGLQAGALIDPSQSLAAITAVANFGGMLSMANLLLSDVCLKFPDLKIVWSEAGIGWIPSVLERADRQMERHQWEKPMELRPSEVFRRNMYVCMVEEPVGLSLYPLIGADRILSEIDFPHADTPFPFTQDGYAEVLKGVPEDVIRAVTYENAERVFNWTMADESLATTAVPWEPPIEFLNRHELATVGAADGQVEGPCRHLVLVQTNMEECALPVGADGVCAAGHGLASPSAAAYAPSSFASRAD